MLGQITQYVLVCSVTPWRFEDTSRGGISVWYSSLVDPLETSNGLSYGSKPMKFSLPIEKASLFPSQGIYEIKGSLRGERFTPNHARLLMSVDEKLLSSLLQKAG